MRRSRSPPSSNDDENFALHHHNHSSAKNQNPLSNVTFAHRCILFASGKIESPLSFAQVSSVWREAVVCFRAGEISWRQQILSERKSPSQARDVLNAYDYVMAATSSLLKTSASSSSSSSTPATTNNNNNSAVNTISVQRAYSLLVNACSLQNDRGYWIVRSLRQASRVKKATPTPTTPGTTTSANGAVRCCWLSNNNKNSYEELIPFSGTGIATSKPTPLLAIATKGFSSPETAKYLLREAGCCDRSDVDASFYIFKRATTTTTFDNSKFSLGVEIRWPYKGSEDFTTMFRSGGDAALSTSSSSSFAGLVPPYVPTLSTTSMSTNNNTMFAREFFRQPIYMCLRHGNSLVFSEFLKFGILQQLETHVTNILQRLKPPSLLFDTNLFNGLLANLYNDLKNIVCYAAEYELFENFFKKSKASQNLSSVLELDLPCFRFFIEDVLLNYSKKEQQEEKEELNKPFTLILSLVVNACLTGLSSCIFFSCFKNNFFKFLVELQKQEKLDEKWSDFIHSATKHPHRVVVHSPTQWRLNLIRAGEIEYATVESGDEDDDLKTSSERVLQEQDGDSLRSTATTTGTMMMPSIVSGDHHHHHQQQNPTPHHHLQQKLVRTMSSSSSQSTTTRIPPSWSSWLTDSFDSMTHVLSRKPSTFESRIQQFSRTCRKELLLLLLDSSSSSVSSSSSSSSDLLELVEILRDAQKANQTAGNRNRARWCETVDLLFRTLQKEIKKRKNDDDNNSDEIFATTNRCLGTWCLLYYLKNQTHLRNKNGNEMTAAATINLSASSSSSSSSSSSNTNNNTRRELKSVSELPEDTVEAMQMIQFLVDSCYADPSLILATKTPFLGKSFLPAYSTWEKFVSEDSSSTLLNKLVDVETFNRIICLPTKYHLAVLDAWYRPTVLFVAIGNVRRAGIISKLIELGADPSVKAVEDETVLKIVQSKVQAEAAKKMMSVKTNPMVELKAILEKYCSLV